jgi:Putative peptidoglycan binding domain
MQGHETPPGQNPDDWFDGIDPGAPRGGRPPVATGGDDWLGDEARPRARRPEARFTIPWSDRRVVIAASVIVAGVILIVGLAVAGVFSGSKKALTPTTTPIVSTPTTPTTTPVRAATIRAPATTLKPGDSGAQVKLLQRALAHLGYPVGKIDGSYGPATKTALTKYQTAAKLTADGVFGPATRVALIKALKAQ